ncbi:hypothetical protein H6P81_016308 [Aristolochia fimbriata]|uniref:Uncharacterized protein n=1 Tax=Aristolochia fimbriata TaxID=158543 RepID=A0AAV7E819_ARIFI|nr:hypothetical protein H6P81_016308 [Aristolochia fimbriata]
MAKEVTSRRKSQQSKSTSIEQSNDGVPPQEELLNPTTGTMSDQGYPQGDSSPLRGVSKSTSSSSSSYSLSECTVLDIQFKGDVASKGDILLAFPSFHTDEHASTIVPPITPEDRVMMNPLLLQKMFLRKELFTKMFSHMFLTLVTLCLMVIYYSLH